ncbi:unnamed protein product [Trifolium pratense]|uniref:Uncharacterized protein n=1 Tax=Trifolium pratense TaxID=57577 RepID=A0ACB0JQ91_TRIPR|nr:unnamed protein product [Trifolium pratense]
MAPTSTRRSAVKKGNRKSFRTVVYPDQDKIEMCPTFRSIWSDKLEKRPWGYLWHPSGNTAMLEFHIADGQCYMTSGRMAAILYGLRQPTDVVVVYELIDDENYFKLHNMNATEVIDLTSDREDFHVLPNDDTYTLPEFENDRHYGWETIVTECNSSDKRAQVLNLPSRTAKHVLRGRNNIVLRTRHNMDQTICTIKTYTLKNNPGKFRMYLTDGWTPMVSYTESQEYTNDSHCYCAHCSSGGTDDVDINFHEVYTWDMEVTNALASRKKMQVMHFPRNVSKFAFSSNQTRIVLEPEDSWEEYACTIATSNRCPYEKYLTRGWYEYKKDMKIRAGDVLKFSMPKYPGFIIVDLIRRRDRV